MHLPSSAEDLLRDFCVTAEHLKNIALLIEEPSASPDKLVADFYTWLDSKPWKRHFLPLHVPQGIKTAQEQYWREFQSGVVNKEYVLSRFSVGVTHARIGLAPEAYSTSMAFSQNWLQQRVIQSSQFDVDTKLAITNAVSILCALDTALVMNAYVHQSQKKLNQQATQLGSVVSEVTRIATAAAEGNFQETYTFTNSTDEKLAISINKMIENFRQIIHQAKAISSGDYSTTINPRSEQDELGVVMSEMTMKLRQVTAQTRKDQWLREGQTGIFERVRGELSTEELCRQVLVFIANRVNAGAGCIYTCAQDNVLSLSAVFGVNSDNLLPSIKFGEGIIGEAAISKFAQYNLDISDNPVRVNFGISDIKLSHAIIIPLVSDQILRGILHLATKDILEKQHEDFLNSISENLAISIGVAISRLQMGQLLKASQAQQEELQSQTEALRVSNEELEERSQALQKTRLEVERKNRELEAQKDTIEQSKLELEKRAREISAGSQYKSEFLTNMSHELRTPLNSMLILLDSLVANKDKNLKANQLESLDVIRSAGKDLLRLINDILDLSKVEAGKLSIHIEEITLSKLVENLSLQFLPVAQEKNLEFLTYINPSLPQTIKSDSTRLEQILKNLLSNAFKFTEKGHVALHIKPASAQEICFIVEDTGIGIKKEQQKLIFDAFKQIDGSVKRSHGGTGLGLSISLHLASLLHGTIEVQSQENEGSTFSLTLPMHTTQENIARHIPASPSPSIRPTSDIKPSSQILIIEDDEVFAKILCDLAIERGYSARYTCSGKEALLSIEQLPPKGIILDIGLPDIDGIQVLKQLKHNLNTRHIPVHILSGHRCGPDALRMGAIAFEEKPTDTDGLKRVFDRFEKIWTRKEGKILVVEDDMPTQTAIEELLKSRGNTIDFAKTGANALKLITDQYYDCIVVDLGLPDMDGTEFLKKLPLEHPPIVIYTAQDLSNNKLVELSNYTESIVIKGVRSPERLLDEVSLFLHQIDESYNDKQQSMLRNLHDKRAILEGKTVLIVDDDMRNLYAMTELLQSQGLQVLKAKNGALALEQLSQTPDIDLVVMDIMMPIMDGFEAMRKIRLQSHFKDLPIIAITAKTLPEDRQACLEAGANDYIAKPMDPQNLVSLMRVLLFNSAMTETNIHP